MHNLKIDTKKKKIDRYHNLKISTYGLKIIKNCDYNINLKGKKNEIKEKLNKMFSTIIVQMCDLGTIPYYFYIV